MGVCTLEWVCRSFSLVIPIGRSKKFHKRILGFILCIFNGSSTDGTKRQKNQCLGHASETSHHHRAKMLEMGRPEIGWYIGNKAKKIHSHEKERHITDWSVPLGKFNKGYGQQHGGNASGTTKTTPTHCHPYSTIREQVILQGLRTGSTDGICSGLHRIWYPKHLGKFQMSKECADNRQELLSGMMYWAKTNVTKIDTAVFFVKLAIEEMV